MLTPLPVDAQIPEILAAAGDHGAAVVVAPPGTGKTTRIPPALVNAAWSGGGQVIVLEPRRIAARAAARRIAWETGSRLGGEVGYHVRFDRTAGPDTRLLIVTEGILTRRLQDDPGLAGVAAVVLDEFHERSLHADLALALLCEVRGGLRPDLRIVVMSATLDPASLAEYLGGAPIIRIAGQFAGVEVDYVPRGSATPQTLVEGCVRRVEQALAGGAGGILVFLPGAGEITQCRQQLARLVDEAEIELLPLHGDLPPDLQDRALQPCGKRKVVLATNVAETSLTVEGIDTVVDCGFARQLRHDPRLGLDRLELRRISRAAAEQRAGRAGRNGPGRAYRLWTSAQQSSLEEFETPEIRRVDLAATVLELLAWGVPRVQQFRWFQAPEPADVERAEALLAQLGAIDPANGRLTALGRMLLPLPLHPRLGRLLVEARRCGYLADAAVLAALMAERDVLLAGRGLSDSRPSQPLRSGPSDLLLRLDLFREAQRSGFQPDRVAGLGLETRAVQHVRRAAAQIERQAGRAGRRRHEVLGDGADARETCLLRAILAGFPDRVVRRRVTDHREGLMVGGRGVTVSASSVVQKAAYFVAVQIDAGRGGGTSHVHWASAVEPQWLGELFPGAIGFDRRVEFDERAERVVARERVLYRDLPLEERIAKPAGDDASAELARAVRRNPARVMPTDQDSLDFITRVRCLRSWHPDLNLPVLDDAALVELLAGLCPGRRSFDELRQIALVRVIKGQWRREQLEAVEREAPQRWPLPSGRRAGIRYEEGKPPVLSARVQDLFGLQDTPRVAGGHIPCVVEILAPNHRPVQITQDLAGFWMRTYPQVRKDLRGRYPRHDWPEVPPGAG